jgi:hypothetical protein
MALLAIDHNTGDDTDHVGHQPTLIILSDVEHTQPEPAIEEQEEAAMPTAVAERASLFDRPKAHPEATLRMRPSMLRRQADGTEPHDHARAERPSALRRSNLSGLGSIR